MSVAYQVKVLIFLALAVNFISLLNSKTRWISRVLDAQDSKYKNLDINLAERQEKQNEFEK